MDSLRELPSVHAVLARLGQEAGSPLATSAVRATLDRVRQSVRSGHPVPTEETIVGLARRELERADRPALPRVINASGVILQTNLGRAPLSTAAIAAMGEVAKGYSAVEYDLTAGERGSRHEHLRALLRRTTGAEDGIVVNNNAAALFMVLQVFAADREVIISRGEAVEIGGGFRIPDVMRQSGAKLVEVGTTNRTYGRDFEEAISDATAALLRVHASNFRVVGFTARPGIEDLAAIAQRHQVLFIDDLGSGCLLDTTTFGMAREPTVQDSVRAGAHLTLFSGDKLLGGPQAGIVVGRGELIAALRRHPLARALRVDKLTIAALAATLQSYAAGRAVFDLPVWRMISASPESVRRRARRWSRAVPGSAIVAGITMVGGGSLPGEGVATWCVALPAGEDATAIASSLRSHDPAVVVRIADGRVLLDPRTVDPSDDAMLIGALRALQ